VSAHTQGTAIAGGGVRPENNFNHKKSGLNLTLSAPDGRSLPSPKERGITFLIIFGGNIRNPSRID
jgi:hypothetical protein